MSCRTSQASLLIRAWPVLQLLSVFIPKQPSLEPESQTKSAVTCQRLGQLHEGHRGLLTEVDRIPMNPAIRVATPTLELAEFLVLCTFLELPGFQSC
ncbi:hypothetical protein CCHR01_12300 [Colletotrichum chrysophilum]|uniref:Secreted protein n=1 Tax=Colletotrichum chrysophilum TaxID=1836956 RepID=A0AAD9ABJ4_9PEZI|nr:hypothetical protein CCHR01_12300 [Colletotrichum chrysophilum]